MTRLLSLGLLYITISSVIVGVRLNAENFQFIINIHSIENRGGRCVDEKVCNGGEGCCESSTCAITTCQYALYYCRLPFTLTHLRDKFSLYNDICDSPQMSVSAVFERNGSIQFPTYMISTFYSHIPNNGLSFLIELLHNGTILIDRFIATLSGEARTLQFRLLNGTFGFASIQISTLIRCRDGYCGIDCDIRNDICFCEPGYTGEDCSVEVNDCEGVSCDYPNMKCEDKFQFHECICLPGFTGEDCETDIDECVINKEDCNYRGKCVNDRGAFHCNCKDSYTGLRCETFLGQFLLEVTIHSFVNPGGKCIDVSGTCANGSGCCDDVNCVDTSCDYMFLFCERPIGTDVSYAPSENRGNCDFMETDSFKYDFGESLISYVHKIPSPIVFRNQDSPINTTEFYIELIDDDRGTSAANNELIDRFVVPITKNINKEMVEGIFNKSLIEISINVRCSIKSLGENCEKEDFKFNPKTSDIGEDLPKGLSSDKIIWITMVTITISILFLGGFLTIFFIVMCFKRRNKSAQASGTGTNFFHTTSIRNTKPIVSLQERLVESIPNNYESVQRIQQYSQDQHPTHPRGELTNNTLKSMTSSYETIPYDRNPPQGMCAAASHGKSEVYCFSPSLCGYKSDGDYDYECPYWEPSNVEDELHSQLHRLNIPNVLNEDLQELETIGSGAFGTVVKGMWNCKIPPNDFTKEEVAVKKIEGSTSEAERVNVLKEAAIMGQFNHPNIIGILGIVTNNELNEYKIIMEYMPNGCLRGYLSSLEKSNATLSSQLLAFSRQIASGMNYLELKKYIHRDLAARNVLISQNISCKICDFGLSRDMSSESFYLAHGGKIPVKWAAPEAINYRLWSSASDVWSYGCVLYEIWSLGYKPFQSYSNAQAIKKIMEGSRLAPPPGCPRVIYELMINCWNLDSEARPNFSQILSSLNEPEFKITQWSEEDKSMYTEETRTIGSPLQDGEVLFVELQNTYKNTDN